MLMGGGKELLGGWGKGAAWGLGERKCLGLANVGGYDEEACRRCLCCGRLTKVYPLDAYPHFQIKAYPISGLTSLLPTRFKAYYRCGGAAHKDPTAN
nr:hypothetical protein Q903MT_gene4854 [Picea sitchensis]